MNLKIQNLKLSSRLKLKDFVQSFNRLLVLMYFKNLMKIVKEIYLLINLLVMVVVTTTVVVVLEVVVLMLHFLEG